MLSKISLGASVDVAKAREAVIQVLEKRGYEVQENSETRIVARHGLSAFCQPHTVEVVLSAQPGKTIVQASIDHRGSKIYLDRLARAFSQALPLSRVMILNSMGKPTTQEAAEVQAKILNPRLNAGEEVIWSHTVQKGLVHKEVVERWVITNLRAFKVFPAAKDNLQERFMAVGLDVVDTVVMNEFNMRRGVRVGNFIGRYGSGQIVGVGSSVSSSVGTSYGDLVFLSSGREIFRFPGVSDPQGIARVIKTLKAEQHRTQQNAPRTEL